jgi:hypothetical protein
MKYLETEEEKKSFAITSVIFVILFVLFFLLRINFFRSPPENGIAINFGTTEVWQRSTDRTHPSAPIATGKAAASNQDILSQDIEEVVIKQTKKTQPSKETAKEEVKQNPKKIRNLQKHL